MRIARLSMDPQDKLRFEIQGKSSVKYHLKANHQVEAKRWYWALNNAIQWAKDEKREEEKRQNEENEALQQAKLEAHKTRARDDATSVHSAKSAGRLLTIGTTPVAPLTSANASSTGIGEDEPGNASLYESSVIGGDFSKVVSQTGTATIEGDLDDDEEFGDDASSREVQPASKDAFNITAQSIRLQLDLLAQVSNSLQSERSRNPTLQISDPAAVQALSAYESSIGTLKGMIGDLLRISKDRDAYWQYRLDREANIRRMWEESMAKVAHDQEELESRIGESEDKRRRAKRALRDALETIVVEGSAPETPSKVDGDDEFIDATETVPARPSERRPSLISPTRRRSTFVDLCALDESDSEEDEEFFDAVDSGEVEVVEMPVVSSPAKPIEIVMEIGDARQLIERKIEPSFVGYEDGIRKRLKLDADNRPKISLWVSVVQSLIVHSLLTNTSGHSKINDRERYDKDDSPCDLQ
jgi:oxysterol-binding protein 1